MHIELRLLPLVALVGCMSRPPVAVEVPRGVPATQFALRITEASVLTGDHPIESIVLVEAPGSGQGSPGTVVWVAAHVKGQPFLQPPITLKLGSRIPGYAASAVPPLPVGRYEALVDAGGVRARTRFSVTNSNVIE